MSSATGVSRNILHTAFTDAPFGIGICDEDGRFLAISRSLATLLRRSSSEIVGRSYLSFVHPEDRGASLAAYFEAVVAVAAGVRHGSREVRYITGDGTAITVLVRWTATDCDESGAQRGIIYFADATAAPQWSAL